MQKRRGRKRPHSRRGDAALARQRLQAAFCEEVGIDRLAHRTQCLNTLRRAHPHLSWRTEQWLGHAADALVTKRRVRCHSDVDAVRFAVADAQHIRRRQRRANKAQVLDHRREAEAIRLALERQ
jgi:uncharacterized protein CbrC (UPF0167 family)